MLDPDTFLTALYVVVDEACKSACKSCDAAAAPRRLPSGPASSLSASEVVTLAVCAQWGRFASERAFYRYATRHLRPAFPTLPDRTQFNRLVRAHEPVLRTVFTALVTHLVAPRGAAGAAGAAGAPYEVLDTTAVPVRNVRRHGRGWLAGLADIGQSTRLGWYEGFALLAAVTPEGVLTGFGFGPASAREPLLAETLLAARAAPRGVAWAAGLAAGPTHPDYYLADGGFESAARQQRWRTDYASTLIAPPRRTARVPWSAEWRRWAATLRQIIETLNAKLHHTFRLGVERPHALDGFQARLAAMAVLHDFCIWLNRHLGRPDLAFADLVDW